jgi:hypothetical protein
MTFKVTNPGFWQRVRGHFDTHVRKDFRRLTAFRLLLTFLVTFGLLRFLTYGIRYHFLPARNVVVGGGLHIHHFVWGIFILLIVGFLSLNLDERVWNPRLAIPFAIGAALVLDEFALWLRLEDNYWSKDGRLSVDVVTWVAALFGIYYVSARFWQALHRELLLLIGLGGKLKPGASGS